MNKQTEARTPGAPHAFVALDALRFVAAVAVVLMHYDERIHLNWLPNAYVAVDFFFILSGFVLAHAYGARLRQGLGIGRFMLRRLIRLYPLYLLAFTASFISVMIDGRFGVSPDGHGMPVVYTYVLSLLFLPTSPAQAPGIQGLFPLDFPAWTLSLEIGVNIFYAAIARRLHNGGLGILLLAAAVGFIVMTGHYHTVDIGGTATNYWAGWPRIFWAFFVGVGLHRIFLVTSFRHKPSGYILLLGVILLAIFSYPVTAIGYGLTLDLIIFPALIFFAAHIISPQGIGKRLATRLGSASYALYITHSVTADIVHAVAKQVALPEFSADPVRWMVVLATLAIAVAIALDLVYDLPMRRFLARRWGATAATTTKA